MQSVIHRLARAPIRGRGRRVAHRGLADRRRGRGDVHGLRSMARRWSDPAEFAGRGVRAVVAGLTEELAVGEFVIAAGALRLPVVELLRGQTTVSEVRTPTGRALARAPGSLAGEALHRFGKTHAFLLRGPDPHFVNRSSSVVAPRTKRRGGLNPQSGND